MAKKTTVAVEPVEITPEDSVVPVWLISLAPEEKAEREQWAADQVAREAADAARVEARASAHAKLADLGLTVDEINAAFNLS